MARDLSSKQIRDIIEKNNLDLRRLLKFLEYPEIEYQVYWLTKILNRDDDVIGNTYIRDSEYWFNSSVSNEEYDELERFELEYYDVSFKQYQDFFYYNAKEHKLYYYVLNRCYSEDDIDSVYEDELSKKDEIDVKTLIFIIDNR